MRDDTLGTLSLVSPIPITPSIIMPSLHMIQCSSELGVISGISVVPSFFIPITVTHPVTGVVIHTRA